MSVSFLNPMGLRNETDASICSKFSNNAPTSLLLLTNGSCTLNASALYISGNCTECSPTTFGFYIPKVANQSELNANFQEIAAAEATSYLFLKENEDAEWILHKATTLATGYANGTAVAAYKKGVQIGLVSESNLSTAVITVRDGGIIIIGVLDTLGDE